MASGSNPFDNTTFGEMTFEDFMKAYPQFDETFIKTMMGKGLKIRVQGPIPYNESQRGRGTRAPNPYYQGTSNTIVIPQHALGDPTVIEHEMAHALTDLDPEALKAAGFSGPKVFAGGIGPGVSMESPGGFLKGLASLIAPNTTTRLAESFAISAAGQDAYPDFKPMGDRRQFDFMFKNKVLPEAQKSAESSDRAMLATAARQAPPPPVAPKRRLVRPYPVNVSPQVPRMRTPTTTRRTRRGGLQEF